MIRTVVSTSLSEHGIVDMEMLVWNMVLTGIVAVLGFVVKEKFAELQRLGILLNRTREEIAREHVTRAEVRADAQMLLDRLDRLEQKIDRLVNNNAKQVG
jgi:hypothetical protein